MADLRLLRDERPPHYPRARAQQPNPLVLERHVAVRPGRYAVGLDRPDKSLAPPPEKVRGTATAVAAYMARVDEVSNGGEVTITLWERPNGREGLTTLSVRKHLGGRLPTAGDLLWIWTWVDEAKNGRRKDRIHVEIETRVLDDNDRARLMALLAELDKEPAP